MRDDGYSLAELIDIERLQRLCDGLSAASGTVLAVLDPDGSILVASGWQDLCTRFHRRNETSAAGCLESDTRINERLAEGMDAPRHIAYKCANGLWDVAFPLVVEGQHVATVFTGQFLYDDEQTDVEAFRARAVELGFDEQAYLEALDRVPILSHDQVEQTIDFLADLVGMLGELGLNALRHERDHAALTASEDRFRSLAEDMPALVCATLADGTITYINQPAAALAGRTAAELTGRSLKSLADEGHEELATVAGAALTPERPVETHEESHAAADGSVRWYEWTSRGFFDAEGRLVRVQAVGRDVSERQRAEDALLQSEQRLRLANKATNDVVWDLDIASGSRRWLATGATVFGWTEVIDGPMPEEWWNERVHPDDLERVDGSYKAARDDPATTSWVDEYRFLRADGSYAEVLDRANILRDGEGRAQRVTGAMMDVTERRLAEKELQESREVLRAVLDAIPVRVFWKDRDLSYLGCNMPFAHDAGFESPEDVVGKDDFVMGWREQAELYRRDDRYVLESGEARLGIEEPQTTPSGEKLSLLTSKVPLRDEQGDIIGVLGSYLDITARTRAEQQAEESRDLMHLIVQYDPNAIAVLDDQLRYIFVSDRFLDDYGVRGESVIGRHHYDVFPDIPDPVRAVHQRVLQGAVERSEEDPFRRADGHVDWVSWECRPWHKADGAIGGLILYSELITERRAAAEELRQSRRQYETFINATDDMAFLKDDQLRYIIVNTANARFFGRGVEEIVGRGDEEFMPAAAAEACRASDLRAIQSGGLVVTTEKQGDRIFESRKFPVALTDGRTGVGGYVRDVTEQRRAEGEIRRLAADLERRVTQRTAQLEATNRELESFAYSISHDLRSPLRALDGFSEILLQDYGESLDDTGRDYLRRIKNAANHMAGLMDGLLQLSRLNREELDFREVDLSAMASAIAAELSERDPARDVVVTVAPGLVARADPKLMRSVLGNLLGNAWKFTSRHETARIEVGADRRDDGVAFFVRDDGAGFDMRYAKNLFGAFQRLHTPDQFEGTGIGLATVQRIVHRHGGSAWAEGEVEKGATFWFTLEPRDA